MIVGIEETAATNEMFEPEATTEYRVLNVGGNDKRRIKMPKRYNSWQRDYLDIDPKTSPDICCDARKMSTLEAGVYDAIYCSHNLEHFYWHEVDEVLAGFMHVLKENGFAEVWVPDLIKLIKHIAETNMDLEEVLYTVGDNVAIRPRDMFYGYAPNIAASGEDFFAHKTGFSQKSLIKKMRQAGFRFFLYMRRPINDWEIGLVAFREYPTEQQQEYLEFSAEEIFGKKKS